LEIHEKIIENCTYHRVHRSVTDWSSKCQQPYPNTEKRDIMVVGGGRGMFFFKDKGGGIRSNLTFPVLNNSDYNMEIIFNETINLIYLRMLAAKLFKYVLYKIQTYLVFTDLILYIYKNLNEEIKHRFSN